ncbi:hypothetical protein F5876DRAFT_65622 [Lentinula aff. lateritia]|uniref:Uncharacterized protein n=1 Tax=Lentinula aff. lateritia TaxID=2804960 RepID=A0ACC1U0H9_9AGAR|nr:hypothetical protein F5876DRAFT_65622 [Lentinula aff. lateritia]
MSTNVLIVGDWPKCAVILEVTSSNYGALQVSGDVIERSSASPPGVERLQKRSFLVSLYGLRQYMLQFVFWDQTEHLDGAVIAEAKRNLDIDKQWATSASSPLKAQRWFKKELHLKLLDFYSHQTSTRNRFDARQNHRTSKRILRQEVAGNIFEKTNFFSSVSTTVALLTYRTNSMPTRTKYFKTFGTFAILCRHSPALIKDGFFQSWPVTIINGRVTILVLQNILPVTGIHLYELQRWQYLSSGVFHSMSVSSTVCQIQDITERVLSTSNCKSNSTQILPEVTRLISIGENCLLLISALSCCYGAAIYVWVWLLVGAGPSGILLNIIERSSLPPTNSRSFAMADDGQPPNLTPIAQSLVNTPDRSLVKIVRSNFFQNIFLQIMALNLNYAQNFNLSSNSLIMSLRML